MTFHHILSHKMFCQGNWIQIVGNKIVVGLELETSNNSVSYISPVLGRGFRDIEFTWSLMTMKRRGKRCVIPEKTANLGSKRKGFLILSCSLGSLLGEDEIDLSLKISYKVVGEMRERLSPESNINFTMYSMQLYTTF